MEKVILFIDGSNFYYGLKSIYEDSKELSYFNFKKFGDFLAGKRKLIRVLYYNAPLDYSEDKKKYAKQQRFFEKVKNTEKVKLILSRLQKRKIKGTSKFYYVIKGDDIHIAVDMVKGAYEDSFDTAILVSGDGDFVPAINIVQDKGKEVENAYFKKSMSWYLKQTCDSSINLTKEVLDNCFD
ncbi:MAG: NYN domain-containing protein [archaeon]